MQRSVVFGLLGLCLGLGQLANAQSATDYQYRTVDAGLDGQVQRSADGGETWETILTPYNPRFFWLVWDEMNPEAVCVYYFVVDIAAQFSQVECSWDAGDNWSRYYLGQGVFFDAMPTFASQLRVDPADGNTLLLTAYDRIFALRRGNDAVLAVDTLAALPTPPACEGLEENQICANLALEGVPAVWYDPELNGQGITIVGREGLFWGYFTVYDAFGDAHWYLFQFPLLDDGQSPINQVTTDLLEFSGPALGNPWDPAQVSSEVVGQALLDLTLPHRLRFSHDLRDRPVTLELVPFQ